VTRDLRAVREVGGFSRGDPANLPAPAGYRTWRVTTAADTRQARWRTASWRVQAPNEEEAALVARSAHARPVGGRSVWVTEISLEARP